MTVLQIIKDLIAEEDVNFGDSDTTFTRQTHTGGSVSVHYIDSKSLPANSLGGYVDTYLHTQHTDTGTTQTTFAINSGGNSATISSSGLTGDRTYTLPDSSQELVGATDLASTASSKGASTVGVEDSGGNFSGTDVEACLLELYTSVASQTSYIGYKRGFKLGYSTDDTITIGGGMWDHRGTDNQAVYLTSQVSFQLGSAGSNADSDTLGANELHYIYIDDSAVVTLGSASLTAAEFVNSTTAPTYSHSKMGWYNSSDRCIGAILTDTSADIVEFAVKSGGTFMYYIDPPDEVGTFASPATTPYAAWATVDVSSSVPAFSTRFTMIANTSGSTSLHCRAGGSGEGIFQLFTSQIGTGPSSYSGTSDIALSSSQTFQWICPHSISVNAKTVGYYMDEL